MRKEWFIYSNFKENLFTIHNSLANYDVAASYRQEVSLHYFGKQVSYLPYAGKINGMIFYVSKYLWIRFES